ncbi:Vacuolar protein sorting 39, partial [Globisporangium splendens]
MASEGGGADASQRAAFRTTTLVSGFEGKVECVTHYSSRVVIGSGDGRLVMYDTRKGTSTPGVSYVFEHGQAVEQIVAVPHIRMVIVISNGELSAHGATDLQPLPFDFSKVNTHKARVVCVNQRGPPHFRLGVALLRRKVIQIYQYHNSDKSYKFLREFAVQEVPESMAWYRNKVVVGFRKDYFLLNDKSGESAPINSPGIQNPQVYPVVKLLPKEEILVSVMDRVGVYVGFNGEPLPKTSITWSQSPIAVEYTAPYLVGLIPRVGVEIHNTLDQSFVQLIPLQRVSCMFGNGMKWDMEPRPTGDPEDVVIVGVRDGLRSSVVKVEQMPLDQQIGELLDRGRIDEAQEIVRKSIAGLPSDKQRSKIKRFQRQATVALLRRLEFEPAADYMYKAAIEPCEYIAFFPDFQCDSFAYEPAIFKPEVLPRGSSMSPDIKSVIKEILASHRSSLASEITRTDLSDLVVSANKSLLRFLELYKKHVKNQSSSRSRAVSRSRSVSSSNSSQLNGPKDARRTEAIDTALFRLYVKFKKQRELLALIEENKSAETCSLELESCEALLLKNKLYYEVGQLRIIQGKHKDAVDVYARLHSGEYKQTNVPRSAVEAAIDVLVAVPENEDKFIYEQSIWIMKATTPKQALRIFTERKPPLSSNDVVAHLREHSDDPAIVQKYLETLVKSERDNFAVAATASSSTDSSSLGVNDSYSHFLGGDAEEDGDVVSEPNATVDPHHTRLALEYLDEVLKLVSAGETPSKSHPGKEPGSLGDARKRLLKFLKSGSSRYDVTPLVAKIKGSALYNEFVILCGRGGLHEEAIQCLACELNDLKGAESYSTKYGAAGSRSSLSASANGKKKKTDGNDALLQLVKLCFNPPDESKRAAFTDFAFQLLSRHGKTMDGKAVLEIIPATTPLSKLVEYFSQVLPNSAHNVREMRIAKSLSNVYNLQVQCTRVEKLNQSVEIDPNTVCFSCKKRIGDIVFAVYPNGNVVHYNCTNGKLDVCPVTGEKFS